MNLADKMALQRAYMLHKSVVHGITVLEAIELYAEQFNRLYETITGIKGDK